MQQQRGGRVVEVVRVVDDEQQRPVVGVVEDRLGEVAQQITAALGLAARRRREQRSEGAVRDGRRAAIGAYLRRPVAALGREAEAFDGQAGLADAGGPREQHAAGITVHGRCHLRELGDPADQRPRRGVHDRRVLLVSLPWITRAVFHARAREGGDSRGNPDVRR
jgi:hypothetical protein